MKINFIRVAEMCCSDAVEAHSCIDIVAKFTDEQYTTINSCVLLISEFR